MKNDDKPPDPASNLTTGRLYNRTSNDLIGRSKSIQNVKRLVEIYAGDPTHEPIFITGERGTGKEIIAESIFNHPCYVTHKKSYLPFNCGTLHGETVTSQLFGHVKGAFTGADKEHKGIMATHHEGTLYLDEIGYMCLSTQQQLQRAIQFGTGMQVGGLHEYNFDIRMILGTHCDLNEMCNRGTFMFDLYDRIRFRPIHSPALRERAEDIPLLVVHLLKIYTAIFGMKKPVTISASALRCLMAYDFPGNVRELEGILQNAVLMIRHEKKFVIEPEHFSQFINIGPNGNKLSSSAHDFDMQSLKAHIIRVLEKYRLSWEGVAAKDVKPLFDGFTDEITEFVKLTVYNYVGSKAKAAKIMNLNLHQFDHIDEDAPGDC
jgi:DNA-binding NtrC family response regulator